MASATPSTPTSASIATSAAQIILEPGLGTSEAGPISQQAPQHRMHRFKSGLQKMADNPGQFTQGRFHSNLAGLDIAIKDFEKEHEELRAAYRSLKKQLEVARAANREVQSASDVKDQSRCNNDADGPLRSLTVMQTLRTCAVRSTGARPPESPFHENSCGALNTLRRIDLIISRRRQHDLHVTTMQLNRTNSEGKDVKSAVREAWSRVMWVVIECRNSVSRCPEIPRQASGHSWILYIGSITTFCFL